MIKPTPAERVMMPSGDIVPIDWAAEVAWADTELNRLIANYPQYPALKAWHKAWREGKEYPVDHPISRAARYEANAQELTGLTAWEEEAKAAVILLQAGIRL